MGKLVRDKEMRGPNLIIESVEKVSPIIESGVKSFRLISLFFFFTKEWFYMKTRLKIYFNNKKFKIFYLFKFLEFH